jgi:hypothetical protein
MGVRELSAGLTAASGSDERVQPSDHQAGARSALADMRNDSARRRAHEETALDALRSACAA